MYPNMFPLAIISTKGVHFSLAHSLYVQLDECLTSVVRSMRSFDVVTHVVSCFLQMFFWERFSMLAPK